MTCSQATGFQNLFDGGAGNDTVDYSASAKGIAVTLNGANDAKLIVGNAAEDTLRISRMSRAAPSRTC